MPCHGPHGALANLLEGALLRERGARRRHKVEREAVEHGVDASAPQLSRGTCTERGRVARAAPCVHASCTQLAVFLWTPSTAERQTAQPVRILDRLETDAARSGVDDEAPTRSQARTLEDRVRRAPRHGQRRCLLKGQDRGHGCEQRQERPRHGSERRVTQCTVLMAGSALAMVLLLGPSAQFRPVIARRLLLESFFSDLAAYRSGAEHRVPVQRDDQWFPRSPYAQCALLDAPLLIGEPSPDTPLSRPPVFPSRPD